MRRIQAIPLIFAMLALMAGVRTLYSQRLPNTAMKSGNSFSLSSGELEFIENKGQLADQNGLPMPEVRYSSESHGMKCYLTEKGMHVVFSRSSLAVQRSGSPFLLPRGLTDPHKQHQDTLTLRRLDMEFAGANPHPRIEAENIADGYYNYYLAHCKLTGIRGFHKIVYRDLYPHIDFTIYSSNGQAEYDFIVHPGGDPKTIAMRYEGMDSLKCS